MQANVGLAVGAAVGHGVGGGVGDVDSVKNWHVSAGNCPLGVTPFAPKGSTVAGSTTCGFNVASTMPAAALSPEPPPLVAPQRSSMFPLGYRTACAFTWFEWPEYATPSHEMMNAS